MAVKREVEGSESQGGRPLAVQAVILCEQLSRSGSNFTDFYPEFRRLGVELLKHAQSRTEPLDRSAFLGKRSGERVRDVRGGAGDVLGWIFRGEVDTLGGKATVEVKRTDAWSGWGVTIVMKVKVEDRTLQMYAQSTGGGGGGTFGVVYAEPGGRKQKANFRPKTNWNLRSSRFGQVTFEPVM